MLKSAFKGRVLAIAAALVLLGGCDNSQAIYNLSDKPILLKSGKEATPGQVRSEVIRTLIAKKWSVKELNSSHIEATTSRGERSATIVVRYSSRSYDIKYKSSVNFEFDENKKRIHYDGSVINRRYNGWIRSLERHLDRNLARL